MRRLLLALIVLGLLAAGVWTAVRAALAPEAVRAAVERQMSAWLGQPVRIAGARAILFPRVAVDLRGIDIGEPVSVHLDSVRIATGLRALLSRVVAEAELELDGGRVALPLPFSLGPSAGSAAAGAPASAGLTIASVHALTVRNVTLAGDGPPLIVDLDSSLDGDRLDVRSFTARADRTRIAGSGVVRSLARLEAELEAAGEPFDLNEIIAVTSGLSGAAPGGGRGAGNAMHVIVKFTAPEGRFSTYAFRELATTVDLTSQRVRFEPLSMRAFGGAFQGQLTVDTNAAPPRLRLEGRLDELDVAELLAASGSPGGVTGRLGGSVSLAGGGSEVAELIANSQGRITAVVTGGRMPGLEMVRTVVLAFGKPSGAPPQGSGSSFSRLGGSFALASGVMTSRDVVMQSRDFDLAGEGSWRPSSGSVQARVDVVLSRELTAQAGTDLRRYAQEDGRVIVPATIGGTLQNPTVTLDVAAATRRALTNELRRRATSLLDKLFKKR